MSGIKISKKFTSWFLSLMCVLSCLFGIFDMPAYATTSEYEAHFALFCDNTILAKQYVRQLCSYKYDVERKNLGELGSGESTEKVVIMDGFGSRKYNVYFHVIDTNCALHPTDELDCLIKHCTGALIFYDVLDPRLEPIIKSKTFHKEDVNLFLSIDTPLNNCIKYLQSFGRDGWWNALNFVMYGQESLDFEAHERYREQLNFYTHGVEKLYVNGDNKWGRNHSVWYSPVEIKNVLGWISGQIYRSIFMEKSLTGSLDPDLKKGGLLEVYERFSFRKAKAKKKLSNNKQKDRDWAYPVYGVLAATTLAAVVGSALIYNLTSN